MYDREQRAGQEDRPVEKPELLRKRGPIWQLPMRIQNMI